MVSCWIGLTDIKKHSLNHFWHAFCSICKYQDKGSVMKAHRIGFVVWGSQKTDKKQSFSTRR